MRKYKYYSRYFIQFTALIALSLVIVSFLYINTDKETNSANRKIVNDSLRLTLIFAKDYPGNKFVDIRATDSKLYLYDYDHLNIHVLTPNGDPIVQIDSTRAPVYFPLSFLPTSSNFLYCDRRHLFLSVLDSSYKLIDSVHLDKISNAGFFSKRIAITNIPERTDPYNGKNIFQIIHFSEHSKKTVGVFPNVENNGMIYSGFFANSEKDSLMYYITMMYNEIFAIDSTGKVIFEKKTVDKNIPKPEVKVSGDNWRTYGANVIPRNLSAATDKDHLYILNGASQKTGDTTYSFLDVYNKRNGDYLHSLLVPFSNEKRNICISISGNRLYFITNTTLSCYQINNN